VKGLRIKYDSEKVLKKGTEDGADGYEDEVQDEDLAE